MTQTPEQQSPLAALADELAGRGWRARLLGDSVTVVNPHAGRLGETIEVKGDDFAWPWGQPIGRIDDVTGTADRVQHVLRVRDDR